MNLEIVWTEAALWSLRSLPWTDAARIDAAVMHFAETGLGDLRRHPEDDASTRRLRVEGYRVRMMLDPRAGRLWVAWIYRADR